MYEALAWLELNRKRVVAAGVGLLALIVIGYVYLWLREGKEAQASQALLALKVTAAPEAGEKGASASDLLKVAADHGSTATAERAIWLAAGELYRQGRYAEAQPHFAKVLAADRRGLLAAMAALAVAACLDSQDKVDEALAAYGRVVADYPGTPSAGRAKLATATIHETRQQPQEALRLFDELSNARGFGSVSREAASRREALLKKHPELAKTVLPTVLSAAAATGVTNPPVAPTNAAPGSTNKMAGQP
jgi:predicted negative regulator of RcsB-dependent stress response